MYKKNVGLGFSSIGKNAVDAKEYIKSLIDGGANEFFTGYNPSYWYERFGFEVSPNMRFSEHEQITNYEILKTIVDEIHLSNFEIYANLNFWYYTDETFDYIKKMVNEFIEIGIDGITCSSIGILEYLKKIDYKGKINISTIFSLYNIESIKFFLENYNINKIILSREITLKEMESIIKSFPKVKFEFFGEGDFCRYNNGLCFAEHKYSNKDICTIIINDYIIKKRFRPDFKKIILNSKISNETKTNELSNEYLNIYEKIETTINNINLGIINESEGKKELTKIIEIGKNRIDLYYDAMKPINSKKNQNIITFLKAIKFVELKKYKQIQVELEKSIISGINFYIKKTKELNGVSKLKSIELKNFYARSDNLNLYSYLFLSKYKNVDTKFPTRGRSYEDRIRLISTIINDGKINDTFLDRSISIERAHYDLTYLFGDELWFRKLLSKFY